MLTLGRLARTLTELGRPAQAAVFAGAGFAHWGSSAETGTRIYQIDRDDHLEHHAMFDYGTTLDTSELVALIDQALDELADDT